VSIRRKLLVALLVLLGLLPSALLTFVVTTETGLAFAAARLQRIGSIRLAIEGVSGSLVDGFRIRSLEIDQRLVNIRVTGITGRIELLPLLWRRIVVPELAIETARVQLRRVQPIPGAKRWNPRFLPSMLRIDARGVTVARGDLVYQSGRVETWREITAAGIVLPKQILVTQARLARDFLHFDTKGRLFARNPIGLEGEMTIGFQLKNQPRWEIAGTFGGDLDRLPLEGAVRQPFNAPFTGEALDLARGWHVLGNAEVRDFDLRAFGGGSALGLVKGEMDVRVDATGFTASGALDPQGLKSGELDFDFAGNYRERQLNVVKLELRHAAAGTRLLVDGNIRFDEGSEPRIDLAGQWQDFRWPLPDREAAARSPAGRFTLQGIRPYAVEASGTVMPPGDLAPLPAELRGTLGTQALAIDALRVAVLRGKVDLAGEVRWAPQERWLLAGRATAFDPAALRADLPGRLDFDLRATGSPFGKAQVMTVGIAKLGGRLRGATARGGGQVTLSGEDWRFRDVDLRFGQTRIVLDGSLGTKRDLRFSIDANDLSLLDPAARGRISARGHVAGNAAAPILVFKARGSDFVLGDRQLASLDADVDLDLRPGGRTQGQLQLRQLQIGERRIDSLDGVLNGTQAAHRATFSLNADLLILGVSAEGGFAKGRWIGQLRTATLNDANRFRLTNEKPAALTFSDDDFTLGELCLAGSVERICAAAQSNRGRWRARLDAGQLPLQTLTAGLSRDITYEGTIGLHAEASGSPDAPVVGEAKAELTQAVLRRRLASGREETFAFGSGRIEAAADAATFSASVGLDAGALGRIQGKLDGRRAGADWPDHTVTGELSVETATLGLLDMYLSGVDRAAGRLTTRMQVSGTLGAPLLSGELALRDGQFDFYQVNLAMRDVTLDATFREDALTLSGDGRVGEGRGKVEGRLAWRDQLPYGRLRVSGENLRIVDVPEARILASPQLEFTLAGRRIDVSGAVLVPEGRLEPADFTNAVLASSDEVIIGEPPPDPGSQFRVSSNITLTLGEKVTINTFGLTGRLAGSLNTRGDDTAITRGTGELSVVEGKYAAFGRNLDIARGRLIFNNVPVADPGIDLRAQKVYPDVTAGVNVRGSLRAPRLTFFSEPAIPQSQIVSLILAGGSLEGATQGGSRSGGARNDLVAQGGAILAQQLGLGSRVGIEDIGIETDPTNDTSLVLGRYLSPRLYVSYGISLAEAINTVKLRYTIGDRWTVRTEAGRFRSADIVYTLQK
jgi:translocation and assembly module TamB